MSKAVVYTRTGNNEGHIDGKRSFDFQMQMINEFCEKENITIIEHFHETECDHDSDIFNRPKFSEMLYRVGDGEEIPYIIVESVGRISRDTLPHLILNKQLREETRARILCVDNPTLYSYENDNLIMELVFHILITLNTYHENSGYNLRKNRYIF